MTGKSSQIMKKYFIKMVLAFFAASDGIVLENLGMRFMSEVQMPEARAFYGFQIMMENVHSEMYSLLIDSYIKNDGEKEKCFKAIENFPCIKKESRLGTLKWINDKRSAFATRLVSICLCRRYIFQRFVLFYLLVKEARVLCLDLLFPTNLLVVTKECTPILPYCFYSKLKKKISKSRIYEIIKEAVEIEKEFICDALPCRLIGMNSNLMTQYIEFVADRLIVQLG